MLWQFIVPFLNRFVEQHLISAFDDDGQGLVEYALLLILVSVVMVAVMVILGPGIGNIYSNLVVVMRNSG